MPAKSFLEQVKEKKLSEYDAENSMLLLAYIHFYSQPFSELMLANPEGVFEPPDDYPRGDDAVWEHDTVLQMKGKIRSWRENERHVLFDGWQIDKHGTAYETDKHLLWFRRSFNEYKIRTDKDDVNTSSTFPYPKTLDDFVRDCHRIGIQLHWRKNVVEKYFKTE